MARAARAVAASTTSKLSSSRMSEAFIQMRGSSSTTRTTGIAEAPDFPFTLGADWQCPAEAKGEPMLVLELCGKAVFNMDQSGPLSDH